MSSPDDLEKSENPIREAAPAVTVVTPALLRDWRLPEPEGSKYSRGQVLVVGGARSTPGAAQLAGLAALRVGAGRLTLAVAESVAIALAVATPEAGVIGLPETSDGSVRGLITQKLEDAIGRADAILIGSGLDDPTETRELLAALFPLVKPECSLVLDAYSLGVLLEMQDTVAGLQCRKVLTPNIEEANRLLDLDPAESFDPKNDAPRIADQFRATVSCQGIIAGSDQGLWEIATGHSGLGTSGSGDVLAGAVLGMLARGATAEQAACWATHVHAAAGDRLTARIGGLGFLARELLEELPLVLTELDS